MIGITIYYFYGDIYKKIIIANLKDHPVVRQAYQEENRRYKY